MPTFTKTKTFRIAAIVALLIVFYALAGFILAPRLLRSTLLEQIPKQLPGVNASVGEIRVNPFLFQVEIKDFSLSGARGTTLAGFERFFIDFDLSSIWHRAYTFSRIEIGAPFANAIIAKDGQLNLLQLSPKPAAPAPEEKKTPIPAVRIGTFRVTKGLVTYEDRSHPSEFVARLEPIEFELQNFTTGVDGGRFSFTGQSKLGERVEWHGHVSIQPIESDGEFQIDGLKAHTIWDYLEDRLNFLVNSGSIDLFATYKFSLKEKLDLKADVSKIAISDLTIRPKGSDTDWITVPKLTISGTNVDVANQQARIDSIAISGVKLLAWLEPDRSVNLLKLAAPPNAPSNPAPAAPVAATVPTVTTSSKRDAAADRPWSLELREFALTDASISAEDRSTKPAVKVLLAPLSVKAAGISLDLAKALKVSLDTTINGNGTLSVDGELTPQPLSANLNVKLSGIDLSVAQPYIDQQTSMTLKSGVLSGDTKVLYGTNKPTLQFSGNLSVANLHTVDNALHDDFINWERLDVQGLNFQQGPNRLDIDEILAVKAYARVIIEPDSSINVKRVLVAPGATVIAPSAGGGTPVAATAPPPAEKRSARKVARAPVAAPAPATAAAGMPMNIKKIVIRAGEANFADLSVMPNFATGIQKLEGSVAGLSSNPASRAKIDLHGSVDAFAPVSITGEVNVLSRVLYTDVAMNFSNIELSTFNPYSGKFAGYNIAKGKLSTELHYKVDGRKLDAQHHIVVDQLEFGAQTESKDAVSLPIKLAVALLKDRDGVIDLNLPITGSLDDPQFKLGPIIWKVFVNILEKAVTAPFALLGSLFGGGPDLQFIDFQPGAAELDPAAVEKAASLVKALSARPQLKIEVPIAVVSELDRPRLVVVKFRAQLNDAQAARKKTGAVTPAFDQLPPAAQLELLTQSYAKNIGGEPKFPEAISSIKTKPEAISAKIDYLTGQLQDHIAISESDLTALGQQRATNVQQALLTGTQIDPSRVFLVANDKAKNNAGSVRLEMSLR
jgi:Domain of Unknown Function (DUF748)